MIGFKSIILNRSHNYNKIDVPMIVQGKSFDPVYIREDVWIGCNCVILLGVKIGKGAIIGAGVIVTNDVGEMKIVGGNPAKEIRSRLSSNV